MVHTVLSFSLVIVPLLRHFLLRYRAPALSFLLRYRAPALSFLLRYRAPAPSFSPSLSCPLLPHSPSLSCPCSLILPRYRAPAPSFSLVIVPLLPHSPSLSCPCSVILPRYRAPAPSFSLVIVPLLPHSPSLSCTCSVIFSFVIEPLFYHFLPRYRAPALSLFCHRSSTSTKDLTLNASLCLFLLLCLAYSISLFQDSFPPTGHLFPHDHGGLLAEHPSSKPRFPFQNALDLTRHAVLW